MTKPGKAEKWAAREARLSAALRENLKRRKAQARGRAQPATAEQNLPREADKMHAEGSEIRRNPGSKSGMGSGD